MVRLFFEYGILYTLFHNKKFTKVRFVYSFKMDTYIHQSKGKNVLHILSFKLYSTKSVPIFLFYTRYYTQAPRVPYKLSYQHQSGNTFSQY